MPEVKYVERNQVKYADRVLLSSMLKWYAKTIDFMVIN